MWRKSSYSGANDNGNCVEVAWRKSSHSGSSDNSACVEVAFGGQVGVRDSKNPESVLSFPVESFRAFVSVVRTTGTARR
ncbi:DUF397 domain-containing protein [Umezawaea endophytica]|uniref:DUF397 domain-containing protein n=1 Tax=Umezawaea endophytica TaxID=1654476 RepID=UPI003557EC29